MSPFQILMVRNKNQIVKSPFEKDYGLYVGRSSPFREGQKDMESFYPFVLSKGQSPPFLNFMTNSWYRGSITTRIC